MNYNNVNQSFEKHVQLLKKSINRNLIVEAAKKPQKVVNTVISITPHSKTSDPNYVYRYSLALKDALAQFVRGNINMTVGMGPNNKIVIIHSVKGSTANKVKKDLNDIRTHSEEWARKNGFELNISWYVDVK